MKYPSKIDLHIHTELSDGTDSPKKILELVKEAGIELFSITDHDAVKGCEIIDGLVAENDPAFLSGAEFSCKDEEGQYHILGYGFDVNAPSIRKIVAKGHEIRMGKLQKRLDFLKDEFGFVFSEKEIAELRCLNNPGKPHIGNLMVLHGYAPTKEEAIRTYLNKFHSGSEYVRPEEAIAAIVAAKGIPVLAHPAYGRGDEIIVGRNLDERLRKLMGFGLRGVEAFYSGFTPKLQAEVLALAEKYRLLVTAGSDYHGKNKLVGLGDANLVAPSEYPAGLRNFLDEVLDIA